MIVLDFTFLQFWDLAGSCFSELENLPHWNEIHHLWARTLCPNVGDFSFKVQHYVPT